MSTPNSQIVLSTTKELSDYLGKSKQAIALALPKHLNPDRMLRLALTAFSTTPKLRECTAQSILASIVVASQVGLEPGVAGQGYLIPYGRNCTFVPGWQGLVGLLNNSGRATAWTGSVFEGDLWDFQLGSQPRCNHVPGPNYGDPSKLIWVYAVGQVNGSQMPVVEAWPISHVWKHRDLFNKVGERHYSFQHPEMYARKVVLLQVLKYMPRSIELNNAITAADAAEMNRPTRVEDGVVIDVGGEAEPIREGAVGGGNAASQTTEKTITERAAEEQSAAAEKTAAKGPKPDELRKALIAKGNGIGAGKVRILQAAAEMRLVSEGAKWEELDAKTLAEIDDAWEQIAEAIKPTE
jgi:recombination protein RecT